MPRCRFNKKTECKHGIDAYCSCDFMQCIACRLSKLVDIMEKQ